VLCGFAPPQLAASLPDDAARIVANGADKEDCGSVKKRLTEADLTAEVLKDIQVREGCGGVSKVVLEQTLDGHPHL
jgi:hypothetical protein